MNERMKELRKSLKLTQEEFAARIGVKRSTIGNYELNRNEPTDSVVALVCREFRVNEQWLRTGEGDMFLPEDTDEIDAITRRYHLGPNATAAVRMFAELPKDKQDVILGFIRALGKVLEDSEPSEELTFDQVAAAEAAYLESLVAARDTGFSPSPMPGDTLAKA